MNVEHPTFNTERRTLADRNVCPTFFVPTKGAKDTRLRQGYGGQAEGGGNIEHSTSNIERRSRREEAGWV